MGGGGGGFFQGWRLCGHHHSETRGNEAVTFWKAGGAEPEGLKVLQSLSAIQRLSLVIRITGTPSSLAETGRVPPCSPRGQEEPPFHVPRGSQPEILRRVTTPVSTDLK